MFENILGNNSIKNLLSNSIKTDKVSHSYMFVGISGIGKKIRVWFGGWLANALGLDVPQSQEYLEEVEKYTVTKPSVEEKEGSSAIYQKMYGSEE